MAAEDVKAAGPDGSRLEDTLCPPGEDTRPPVLEDTSAPLNFSELTPSQFGITVQSFTPASASHCKDKSRLAQIKARRRSNIGVRGSPETNSLIRFIAQQRMKTPPASQTPELVRSGPCFPRVPSTLRQKMASFQTLMDVEESDARDPKPARDGGGGGAGGCIKTRDYLSDGSSCGAGKENSPPVTPTPSKRRRRLGPLEGCSQEIREAGAPLLLLSSAKEQEVAGDPVMPVVTRGQRLCRESVGELEAALSSQPLHVHFELNAGSPPRDYQDGVFEVQSPRRPPPVDPAAASPPRRSSPFLVPSLPPLLERRPAEEERTPAKQKARKQVRFGGPLSPELFDRTLPPSTPLQRGGTPARAPTPGGSLQLRSLLKTPQGSATETPPAQPDPRSPAGFGASPTLSVPRRSRRGPEIVFPSLEEIDSALTKEAEYMWDAQPLNLNNAFQEECLAQTVTAEASEPESSTCQMEELDEPASSPQEEQQPEGGAEAPADLHQTSSRNKKLQGRTEQEAAVKAPARSGSRKRKQPEEGEPVKRSTRSAAKAASGKRKVSAAAARRWSKDVDHSLYGSRTYASKDPSLSPITERPSFIGRSPAAEPTATNQNTHPNPEAASDTLTTGVVTSEDLIASNKSEEDAAGRLSGLRVRGRGETNVAEEEAQEQSGEKEENCENQTTISLDASLGAPAAQGEADTETLGTLTSEHTLSSDSECRSTYPAPKRGRRGRSRSANTPVLQELQNHAGPHQTRCEVQKEQADQAASQQENMRSGSVSQAERPAASSEPLAPWQADFNFEDVFQPVATRGQRSVRRSLRNRCDGEGDGAGLAWLPRTSPDSLKETRRRTRGRRLSETQD